MKFNLFCIIGAFIFKFASNLVCCRFCQSSSSPARTCSSPIEHLLLLCISCISASWLCASHTQSSSQNLGNLAKIFVDHLSPLLDVQPCEKYLLCQLFGMKLRLHLSKPAFNICIYLENYWEIIFDLFEGWMLRFSIDCALHVKYCYTRNSNQI